MGFAAERRCGRPVRGGRRAVARRRAARVVPPAGAAGRRDARRPDGDDRRFEREPRPQVWRTAGCGTSTTRLRRSPPASHHDLYLLVVLAAGAFCLAVAITAGSRPFVAAALATAGVAWPATLMPTRNTVATGGLCVIVALWPLVVAAAADRRGLARGTGALACVTLAAVVAAGVLGARPSAAALDWQNWNLFGESGAKRAVSLVWSSNYGGIDFPAEKTTVLRITAPHRALYWRATTLDLFTSNRWVETLYTTDVSGGNSSASLRRAAATRRDGAGPLGAAGGRRPRGRRRPRRRGKPADAARGRGRPTRPVSRRAVSCARSRVSRTCASTRSGATCRGRHRPSSSGRRRRIRRR